MYILSSNLQSYVIFELMVTQPKLLPYFQQTINIKLQRKMIYLTAYELFTIPLFLLCPKTESNKWMVSNSGSWNLPDKLEELTFAPQGEKSSIEPPQTYPFSLSRPLCIQVTFSTSKIWYQHGLPPVSLCETQLAGFQIERRDYTDCKRLLWCVCLGAWDGLRLYPHTIDSSSPQKL